MAAAPGTPVRIGAHVEPADPLAEPAACGADVVQFFLADPQGFKTPKPRADAAAITAADVQVFIHAPYLINVVTTNNRIRIPSRKLLDAHAKAAATVGASGLIGHGGHLGDDDDPAIGVANWCKVFQRTEFPVPILIENTAGGDNAMARHLDRLAMLWDAVGEFGAGFCLDTCHAWAGGEDLDGIVDRVLAITGRIDLVHANDSRDPAGSARDRHTNVGSGEIGAQAIATIVAAAGAPAVCETPGGVDGQRGDIDRLRAAVTAAG
ncbi:MAG: deoxyribonuclease IV [Mycobacteriales bacterium]